jgi:hypothetical protein
MSNDYAQRPERLWLVGVPPDELEQDAQAWREAAKALGALSEAFTVIGRSDAPFVALLDAKVRCKKHAERLEAEGAPPKVEYPTVFAEVVAELAGYLGEDLARLAGDLASAVGQPRGEEADREVLGTRLESADARPPSATFMDELARRLDLDRGSGEAGDGAGLRELIGESSGVSFAGSPGPTSCPYSADVGGAGSARITSSALSERSASAFLIWPINSCVTPLLSALEATSSSFEAGKFVPFR